MTTARAFAAVGATVGWVALDLQLVALHINAAARGVAFWTATVNYFSYFTILANILATLVLSAFALDLWGVLRRPAVTAAAAMYMAATGVVYFTILRHIWNPQGLDWVADTLLHYVMPVVYVLFWLIFASKAGLTARHAGLWLLFPVVYSLYSLVRGALMGFYPYPFIDVNVLGYPVVFRNAALLAVGFAILGALVVVAARARQRS